MKVKLLNHGGYAGMGNVDFPVVVEGEFHYGCYLIKASELYRVGAKYNSFFSEYEGKSWAFVAGQHAVEVIS